MKIMQAFERNFIYTQRLLPKKTDTSIKYRAKWAGIILSLGFILVIFFTIDCLNILKNKLFVKKNAEQQRENFIEDQSKKNLQKAQELLKIEVNNDEDKTPLMIAVKENDIKKLEELIAKTNVDQTNEYGHTALMIAAELGHIEVVKKLINAKASIDLQNKYGNNALMIAVVNSQEKVVKELIKAKANINLQKQNGQAALMLAVDNKDIKIVRELIKAKPRLDLQNKYGETALKLAKKYEYKEIEKILIRAQAHRAEYHIDIDAIFKKACFNLKETIWSFSKYCFNKAYDLFV